MNFLHVYVSQIHPSLLYCGFSDILVSGSHQMTSLAAIETLQHVGTEVFSFTIIELKRLNDPPCFSGRDLLVMF